MSSQKDNPSPGAAESEAAAPAPGLRLEVSPDKMVARIHGRLESPGDAQAVQRTVGELLRNHEVRQGLVGANLRQAIADLQQGKTLEGVVVARGLAPQAGRHARVEVLVEVEAPAVGREDEKGHIDFRDRGTLPVVEEGTPLARLHPARPGKPGRDVTGCLVQPEAVESLRLERGRGVVLEEEGLLAVAGARGLFHQVDEDHFEVLEELVIQGNVDFKTGHVEFPGVVRVSGAVLAGFVIKASFLEIREMEPGSRVETTGDILVHRGIMGAKIKAGGQVGALYIRDSEVQCEGDLTVETEIVGSNINAGGRVRVSSPEGRIVNSLVSATGGVIVGEIISSGTQPTIIRLGPSQELQKRLAALRKQSRDLQEEKDRLEDVVLGQADELKEAEEELRSILIALKDPAQQDNRDNLLSQLNMIKPLRENLKAGLASGQAHLDELVLELSRHKRRLARLEAKLPAQGPWLDVRRTAGATTEIITTRASQTLERPLASFSAREVTSRDEKTGKMRPVVKLQGLRSVSH